MNLVADENLGGAILDRLAADGHAVTSIRVTDPGATDPAVLAAATRERAVLLTQDKDFGELVYRRRLAHAGVVLVRLAGVPFAGRAELVCRVLRDHAGELAGAFTVITARGVRIRRPDPPPADDPS
ncbi:MAG: DUF5615 family PIN-like protein [Gemmataceae bacterium]|nr:DUF5615 family PIN-like protein [Gemmataceae bacterium]